MAGQKIARAFCWVLLGLAATMAVAEAGSLALPLTVQEVTDEAAQQIATGQGIYQARCTVCHGLSGEGGFGPALVGPRALRRFRTASSLRSFTQVWMPSDAPGTLSEQASYDVIAFLLSRNALNPDVGVLNADSIERIVLE